MKECKLDKILSENMVNRRETLGTHYITGKALLVVDAGLSDDGKPTYDTVAYAQSATGLGEDVANALAEECSMMDGHTFDVPKQCRNMKPGDRWRIAVTYEVGYIKSYDHYYGAYEWDVTVELSKCRTLRKQPWSDKRHKRYVAKAKR